MDGTIWARQDLIFSEIMSTNFKLQQLGMEAQSIMKKIKHTVGQSEAVEIFEDMAKT